MDQVVTLNWLNCLCDSSRRAKLRKLTDAAVIDHLLELLVKFQFCTPNCTKFNKEDKKQLIVKFLITKVKDYNSNRLFIDEENILVACWIFLFHIVWSLEDATLRNHLSFHLDNASQEFIKAFLESVQEQSEISESIVAKCLERAKEKCGHLDFERSPKEFVSRASNNSTPTNQTPTGIKRKMSLTLREFLMSPNSQKKFVEEHTKELKRLKIELNNEISEKVEVMEENDLLKQRVDQLSKQLDVKLGENLRLRREIEIIECNLSEANSATKSSTDERELSDLRIRLDELHSYVHSLEMENASILEQLSTKEKNIISITEECETLKKQFDDLHSTLICKEEIIQRLSDDKEFFKIEINNLKEFNQDLLEKIAVLESARLNPTVESNAPNLESELQFQLMKDTIEWAKKNMSVIETEQTRLMNENRSLNERVKNLVDEKKEIDLTLKDLNSRIDTLKTENISLKSNKENLSKKLKQTESKLHNTNRDFESYRTQNESSTQKLIDEKGNLQSEMYELKQSLDQYARIADELSSREEYLVAELETTKEHLHQNETLLEDFNVQMEHLKSENLKLSMKLNDLESQNKTANAKLTEASKEKTKLLKIREEMERKLAKNKETIESLVKQTAQEQDRCKELTKMVEVHMKKIEQSESSLKKLEEDRIDLNKRLNIQNEELKLTETRYRYEAEAHTKVKNKLADLEKINVDQKSVNEQLETDLKSKLLESKTLVCKIKELEEYLQQTEHVNKKLKISLDEVTKEKEKITIKYSNLEEKSNLDHSVIQSLTDQLTQLQNQNTDLERKIQTLTEQANSDAELIQDLRNDNTKLADQLKDISAELKVVLEDLSEKINSEKQLEESISHLREESGTLKASLKKVNSEKQTVCDKFVDLTHQHENLLNERINLIESIKSFETQVPSLNEEIVGLRNEVNQLTGTNESLKNQLVELTSQMQSVEAEKLATKTQYDSIVQQLQNLENTYADMIKNKQQLEKSNAGRQKMIVSLQNDLKSASALNMQLDEKLACLEKETSHLRSKLDDYEEKSKSLQDIVVRLEAANQRLSADCDVLTKQKKLECDEYELKIAALNEDVLGIRDQLEKMTEINETQLKNLESTTTTLQQTQIEKEHLQKENSALMEEKHRIDLDLKNETKRVEKLEDKIVDLERLFGDQTTEMKLLKNNYTRSNEDNQRLNDQLKDLENHICEVQERLKASVQEAETLESEKKSLLKKIVDFEHSFDELQQQNQILLKNVQDATTEKQTIAFEKEDLIKRTKSSDEIIKNLNSEIVDLQNRIDKLSGESKCYEDQLKLAETALTSVKEQRREFEEKYEKIYEELNDIQETAKESNSKLQLKIAQLQEINDNQKIQIEKLEQNLSNEATKLLDVERKLNTAIEQHDTEALAMKNENERLYEENKTYLEKVKRFEELQSERESLLCTLEQKECKLNEITSRWKVELDTMRNERARDAAKIVELLEDCKMQQETVTALTKELTELQKRYEELNEYKTRAMNELREMFLHQIDQLLSNNETLQNENIKLCESNKEKIWYLNEMRKRISPIIDALEEHEKKLLQLKEQNDVLTKEIDECNGNKWTLKSQNEQLAVLVAQTDKEKERLNKEIQNLKDEKEILRFKTDELKLDNEEIKHDNNRIRKLMRKESSEHEELKKRTEILNEKVEEMRKQTEKLSTENDKIKQYIKQLERDHDKQLETKNTEIDEVKISTKELQSELELLRSKHEDLSKCNEKLIEERNAVLDQKFIFEQDNMKLKRRLEEITAQKNEVYTMNELNNKALENRIQSLISQNDDQLVTIQNLRGENEVLRSEIESVKTNAAVSTRKQVEKLEKKIDDLTTTNAQLNQSDALHKKEVESLSEANHRLQVIMEKQTNLNKSLEIKLVNYETLISEKTALTKRVDELKMKLDESLEQNERITDEMNLIADKNAALVKENENLLAKMEELETKVDNLNDTVISKDKEIFLLQDEYRIFKDEYRKLSEHKSELDKDWKETLINNFKSATAQCDELNEKNRKLTEEIAENQSTITALEAEIEQIKGNSAKLDETRVIASGSDNKTNLILKEENQKLAEDAQNMKKKMLQMKAFLDKEKETYRQKSEKVYSTLTTKIEAEFSDKLERAKSEYNKLIQQKYSMKEIEWKKKEENYQKMLRKEKEHIKELSSQLWNMSDKYLSLRQNVESGGSSTDFRRYSVDNFFSPGTLSRRTQSATHLNMMDAKFPKPLDFDRRLSTMSEDIQFHTKNKKSLALTSGKKFSLSSAKVFPTEDEEMEIFDNACLADLKRGRMADDSDFNKQRLSVLQARNSLCPPHLKSSYPAETQFLPVQQFKENDIKMGLNSDINEHSDIENLLPGDRSKKNRNQTSYKKPGPPTPSKHGGRASTIGVETPRNVLKESNDNGTARRKSFTPRLFNIFPIRGHATVTTATSLHNQDENPSITPKRNRLQSLRRRFSKNPQELGNTNSGFS